ncbi:hypothetical protein DY000_02051516 [Brassica cretica]|uniref:Uncharacterized protein n=1 Tax=Brassica cretica TaxID=69181 RepID=A0ABQ7ER67_BRACR|nr:hypothetical protein DY000_02051516 [Brassica cretica]
MLELPCEPELNNGDGDICFSLDDVTDFGNNFFYNDCSGVVNFSELDYKTQRFTLPGVLLVECSELEGSSVLEKSLGLLPSDVCAIKSEIGGWRDCSSFYSFSLCSILSSEAIETSELRTWILVNSTRYGVIIDIDMRDPVLFLFRLSMAAAVAALYERSMLEGKMRAIRYAQPLTRYQRVAEHGVMTAKAVEERKGRSNYRPIIDHDGRQRVSNQDMNKMKTREELLAEERDYKRRRMSYRGRKVKRTPRQVLRDIIEEFTEEVKLAGNAITLLKLKVLPTNVKLQSLSSLDLSSCTQLRTFPEISTSIRYLNLSDTAIEEVPSSIWSWSRLLELNLEDCRSLRVFHSFPDNIEELDSDLSDTGTDFSGGDSETVPRLRINLKGYQLPAILGSKEHLYFLESSISLNLPETDVNFSELRFEFNIAGTYWDVKGFAIQFWEDPDVDDDLVCCDDTYNEEIADIKIEKFNMPEQCFCNSMVEEYREQKGACVRVAAYR